MNHQHLYLYVACLLAKFLYDRDPQVKYGLINLKDNGFTLDFQVEQPISENDFPQLEAAVSKGRLPVASTSADRQTLEACLSSNNQAYLAEHLQQLSGQEFTCLKIGDFQLPRFFGICGW